MSQLPPYNVIVATGALTGPQAEGFGTILCVGYHNHFADLYRQYTSLAAMVSDGFAVYEPIYLMAAAIFAQTPHPQQIAVGKVPSSYVWAANLFVGTATGAGAIAVDVTYLGTTTHVSITGTGVPNTDAATLATAIHAAFSDLTCTTPGSGNTVHAAAPAGAAVFFANLVGCTFVAADAAPGGGGFSAALAAIQLVSDNFYGVAIESQTAANIESASTWCDSSATPKVFFARTQDWTEADGTLGDSVIGTWLAARPNSRTALSYHPNGQLIDAAFAGNLLAYSLDQGPIPTGAFRQLSGINGYSLQPGHLANFRAKNTNVFVATKGVYFTWEGTFGGGTFIDVTISLDWLNARIGEAVLEYQLTCPNGRIPYTIAGIQHVGDVVWQVLEEALTNELFAPTMDDPTGKMVAYTDPITGITSQVPAQVQSPQMQLPTPAQCSVNDRRNRILGGGGIRFQGRFGGAIHFVNVNGIVLF